MRYTCPDCGKWVKDKFFFGLLHVCLSEEERRLKKIAQGFIRTNSQMEINQAMLLWPQLFQERVHRELSRLGEINT